MRYPFTADEREQLRAVPAMCKAAAAVLRPPEDITPSEFAESYRYLKPGTTWQPGRWSNEVFPYLVPIMDAIKEAIDTGKRGVVLMKSGQGGGSEAMINALLWIKTNLSGPLLYLISKDELAREFVRDRFSYANLKCAPVAAKSLTGYGSGASLHQLRYADGKVSVHGSGSLLNVKSEPRRVVFIDEIDDFPDDSPEGDPLKIAEIRVDAFMGATLIVAFAHPTTKERGAGRLYYTVSDQRRGHITCPMCAELFWLNWKRDVKVRPHEGQTRSQAERDASCYAYVTPCCDAPLSDAQRWAAIAAGCQQLSTLEPEVAARKQWIGVHFSQLYMSNKTLQFLAEKHIEGLDDPSIARVVVNKRHGECFTSDSEEIDADAWYALRGNYDRGTMPDWVSFLTSGADFNSRHLHFAVWGWGLRFNTNGQRILCGALVEWAELERPNTSNTLEAADLAALDQHLIDVHYLRPDGSALGVRSIYGDSGWQPTAVYEWCRGKRGAVPVKGGAEDDKSQAPVFRWGKVPPYLIDGALIDSGLRLGVMNTFKSKEQLFALAGATFELLDRKTGEVTVCPRLVVPENVDDLFCDQAGSEYKAQSGKKTVWRHRGPNHLADCSNYAYVGARNLYTLSKGRTSKEEQHRQQRTATRRRPAPKLNRRIRREY